MSQKLVSELFVSPREILNRGFDKRKENIPARIADDISTRHKGSCQGSCQCVSCFSGCYKG